MSRKVNHSMPKQIGDYNKNLMLSILRENGPASRVELSQILGISPTAVSRNIAKLIENGIIRECGAKNSNMGRKPVLLELCSDYCYLLGADISGGTIKVALADLMGTFVKYNEEPVQRTKSANVFLKQLIDMLQKTIAESGVPLQKIWTAVIGCPGFFDPETGKSRFSFFLSGWETIDIRSKIFNALSVETLIENDANLDIIGESWKGIGKDYENILYVKFGLGLAARVVLQNKLLRGEHKMAGEIGCMLQGFESANQVSYEKMLTNDAVSKRYSDMGGTGKVNTISDLCSLANNGDKTANEVLNYLLDGFAVVLLNSAAVIDPQVIILGGDACCFKEKEISLLKKRIERHLPFVQNIVPSKLSKNACLYGAVKTGLDNIEEKIINIW